MAIEVRKSAPVMLRSLGLDERWLQEQINRDPSILGLGELEIAGREHNQPQGGRIDFLMRDLEAETYYEVEVMLGPLDESHIIRTIEYWDIERQRRPSFDHRAVIVAERITARFFNVLRLLNRSVPLIAVQLSAFRLDLSTEIVLHPVKVLDVIEETEIDVADVERADRSYWEKKANPGFLKVVDGIAALLRNIGIDPRITYNRYHVALGWTGYNFCWLQSRTGPINCRVEVRLRGDSERRDEDLKMLLNIGMEASPRQTEAITFSLTMALLEEHSTTLKVVLKHAAEAAGAKS